MAIVERAQLVEFLRGELMGPIRSAEGDPGRKRINVPGTSSVEPHPDPGAFNAWLYWKPEGPDGEEQEILSISGGSNPYQTYGVGVLYPAAIVEDGQTSNEQESEATPPTGLVDEGELVEEEGPADEDADSRANSTAPDDDLEIQSSDANRPSSMAITFCLKLGATGALVVSMPRSRRTAWQTEDQAEFPLNGFYERFQLRRPRKEGQDEDPTVTAWRRRPAVAQDAAVRFPAELLAKSAQTSERTQRVPNAVGIPESFRLDVLAYPRPRQDGSLLVTVVLRNKSEDPKLMALFQTQFEVSLEDGEFLPYPESERPFHDLDRDEQSMELLYRNTRCWGIGHGCAAGWSDSGGKPPTVLTADVLPAVELPSMTPDIDLNGQPLSISMSELADLPDKETRDSIPWIGLAGVIDGYGQWIDRRRRECGSLDKSLQQVAEHHLFTCVEALERMRAGLDLLRNDPRVRDAFRWTNEAMLLQQIALKQVERRELAWINNRAAPVGNRQDPFQILKNGDVDERLGKWRAFQIAFLLMSLRGMVDPHSADRELVDLVWFPTGGGKTEAYLGVAAFELFHQRLLIANDTSGARRRDGTTVLMRYTLRMLTTDQFQRAASLICGMEQIRRRENARILGGAFRLGLWLGQAGAPNTVESARTQLSAYAREKHANAGNPLVLTECPWCRAAIGRLSDDWKPTKMSAEEWRQRRLGGLRRTDATMRCSDPECVFGGSDDQLPVDVIDERIYENTPSLVIGTADKFAMLAYTPKAGALFGRTANGNRIVQTHRPPSLIIQDELHLISGPLGTLFGLYETVFNDLCTLDGCQPKIVSSTATVRGADRQVRALFARERTALFPPPGLDIADSFFGRYAKEETGKLKPGRLYVGIHALYGSLQTTQARVFSALLARATTFDDAKKDPWWTLLAYYNSMRELSGARTLFQSDIDSRLGHLASREGIRSRHMYLEELSSRLSQAEIVALKDRLAKKIISGVEGGRVDACLSSNIIEVGVDIERLSLMAVVGQPKSTASYIQASGRVGRKWWERPGLIVTLLNPRKSRDASHFEQFHTYHRRLYERVEPTSATPFSIAAMQRGFFGAMLAHVRQQVAYDNPGSFQSFEGPLDRVFSLFRDRCQAVGLEEGDQERSLKELDVLFEKLKQRWRSFSPQQWNDWNQPSSVFPLMLVPGKFATGEQKRKGFEVPTSLRQVDAQAELSIDSFEKDDI